MSDELCTLLQQHVCITDTAHVNNIDVPPLLNEMLLKENKKLSPKQMQVLKVFSPDENGHSNWIDRSTIEKNPHLNFGRNGNSRHGTFFNFHWCEWEKNPQTRTVTELRMCGWNENFKNNLIRPIKKEIVQFYSNKACVACGTNSGVVVDHKNDLYNDDRVLSVDTQTFDDFQTLCQHCNLQKRQVMKKTRETGRRYGATNIPMLACFGIDFTKGDSTLNKEDPNAMVGTFWHDPVDFLKIIHNRQNCTTVC